MESIHQLRSGSPNVQSEIPKKGREADAATASVLKEGFSYQDSVEISKESEIKRAALSQSMKIEEQVAAQNQLAQHSAQSIEGLGLLGVRVHISVQSSAVNAVFSTIE